MNNNTNCLIADTQREVFDNLCKNKWDAKLQVKFGEYAEINCDTRATVDGGETFLTLGIYNVQEELINFSQELSNILGISNDESRELIEKYIEIFNVTADVEWDEDNNKPNISILLDEPFVDELTPQDDLEIIKNEEKLNISEKLGDCIAEFIEKLMHDADLEFGYKWNEWNTCNPE